MIASIADRRRDDLPLAAVVSAVFFWSFGPLIVRGTSVSSMTFTFWRLWLAVPVMWVAAYALGGRMSATIFRRALVPGVLFGGSMMTSFAAFRGTSIANATLIPSLTPAVVLIVAPRLLGEQRNRRHVGLALLAFAGVTVVVLGGGPGGSASIRGDLFAVANLAVWATYLILAKQVRNDGVHAWALIATFFTIAAVVATPFCLVISDDLGSSQPKDWLLYFVMLLIPGLMGHGLMTWAQEHVDLSLSSVLTLANAPLSMLGAWLLYDQSLRAVQIVGVAAVIGALATIAIDQTSTSSPIPIGEPPT